MSIRFEISRYLPRGLPFFNFSKLIFSLKCNAVWEYLTILWGRSICLLKNLKIRGCCLHAILIPTRTYIFIGAKANIFLSFGKPFLFGASRTAYISFELDCWKIRFSTILRNDLKLSRLSALFSSSWIRKMVRKSKIE